MEKIEWPQETNTALKIDIVANKVNEIVEYLEEHEKDHDGTEKILADWFTNYDDRLATLEKKYEQANKAKPRLRRSSH